MFTLGMDSIAWLAVVATLLVILHVAVAAYLYRRGASNTPTGTDELRSPAVTREPSDPTRTISDDASERGTDHVPCPTCGTPNDPSYRFCRRCIADLTGSGRAGDSAEPGKRLGS
jgi:hypothetical protein